MGDRKIMAQQSGLTRRRAAWLTSTALIGVLALAVAAEGADPAGRSRRPAASGKAPARPRPPPPRVVVLDPGHGGPDPGTMGASGTYEKTVVLAAAREMARQLAASRRYKAVLTRHGDRYVPLRERVARARAAKAELFISVHADWHPNRSTRGASVYTLSDSASDREAAALAAKENKADVVAGVDLRGQSPDITSILIDLSQRDTINQSRTFAGMLLDSLADSGVDLLGRSHRHAGFAVLTAPDTPAVLLEIGYLSNRQEERLLVQPVHLRRLALAVVAAADRYFASRPTVPEAPPSAPSVSKPPPPPRPAAPSAPKKA